MDVIWIAFVTGLTTGGISCLAVQGGLLASITARSDSGITRNQATAMFLIAKLAAYALFGFALGFAGASLSITPTFQGYMQIAAGAYMLATAANLLNLHPIFRYVVIQPPKGMLKVLRKQSKQEGYFAPATLGALTVLIPCGITQGMMVLAVSSGNPLAGAGIMFAFTLGTTPIFALLGLSASKLMERRSFLYAGALAIAVLGVISVNTGQTLRGSVHTLQNYKNALLNNQQSAGLVAGVNAEGTQEVTIDVNPYGYSASANTLHVNTPVRLTLRTKDTYGCSLAFSIPSMNITAYLKPTGEETIEFTPTKTGRMSYSCSMGMYGGEFIVI